MYFKDSMKRLSSSIEKYPLDTFIISISIIITILLIIKAYGIRDTKSEILVDFQPVNCLSQVDATQPECYKLKGVLLKDGEPVENALVWLIIQGKSGYETYASPVTDTTNKAGEFQFNPIPKYLSREQKKVQTTDNGDKPINKELEKVGKRKIVSRTISSKGEEIKNIIVKIKTKQDDLEEKTLEVNRAGGIRTKVSAKVNIFQIAYLPFIFLLSILFPIILCSNRAKYYCSIIAAIIFSIGMILTISIWISYVSIINPNETLSLGFFHFSHYLNEWVLSLTSPQNIPHSGFWVPVWVMMLSVIGSSLFTILLILKRIEHTPKLFLIDIESKALEANVNEDAKNELPKILENIVRHQFYILFSPLGSIFVYQLLILGDAAGNQTTVAIAALASGIALNTILDKAISLTENLLKPQEAKSNNDKKENGGKN